MVLYEVRFPTIRARIDRLFVLLPAYDHRYSPGDMEFKEIVRRAFDTVGLPGILLTDPILVDEIRFVKENLEQYGNFRSPASAMGSRCFTVNGIDYILTSLDDGPEKVYFQDDMEPADEMNPEDYKPKAVSPQTKFFKYLMLLRHQKFWVKYKITNPEGCSMAVEDTEYQTDFMSTYRACIDLAMDDQFLKRLLSHFRLNFPVDGIDITKVITSVYEARQEHNKKVLVNMRLELNKAPINNFSDKGAWYQFVIKRFAQHWMLHDTHSSLLYYLELCREMEMICQVYEGGMPNEIHRLLESVDLNCLTDFGDERDHSRRPMHKEMQDLTHNLQKAFEELHTTRDLVPSVKSFNRIPLAKSHDQETLGNRDREAQRALIYAWLEKQVVPEDVRSAINSFLNSKHSYYRKRKNAGEKHKVLA